ncbi:hypothetical protein [Streptomyces sp. MW-W600-10]|uniref:ISAzo13-like element transposase-related protein n=1 Tax=Streptomyces sp. MW-W600-10 TaxID=2829819 RepID=UPI0035AC18A1
MAPLDAARAPGRKTELATPAAETGPEVAIRHMPSGTPEWNEIEHRLFSRIPVN